MTLSEFMEKMRGVYDGNERDFGPFRVMVACDSTVHDFAEVVFYPDEAVLCDAATADTPPVPWPAPLGKTFVLEKIWFDRYGYERSKCYSFDTFERANRAMFDDWTEEYDAYMRENVLHGEEFDRSKHDPDGFWESQSRPFEGDDAADIRFPDESRIDWLIHETEVENGAGDSLG